MLFISNGVIGQSPSHDNSQVTWLDGAKWTIQGEVDPVSGKRPRALNMGNDSPWVRRCGLHGISSPQACTEWPRISGNMISTRCLGSLRPANASISLALCQTGLQREPVNRSTRQLRRKEGCRVNSAVPADLEHLCRCRKCGAGKTRRPRAVRWFVEINDREGHRETRGDASLHPRSPKRPPSWRRDYLVSDTTDGFRPVQSLLVIGVTQRCDPCI